MIDWILFGESAKEFSEKARYGHVVAMKEPKDIEKDKLKPWILTVNSMSNFLIIGQSKDYGIWAFPSCHEFLNKTKTEKCTLHRIQDNDLVYQRIKAQRPYLKSNYIDKDKTKRIRTLKREMIDPVLNPGFTKIKIAQNEHCMTEKQKKKVRRKVLFEKNEFTEYLKNRTKIRTGINQLSSGNLKFQEKEFIKKHNIPAFDFPKIEKIEKPKSINKPKKGMIEMDPEEEIDFSYYKKIGKFIKLTQFLVNYKGKDKEKDEKEEENNPRSLHRPSNVIIRSVVKENNNPKSDFKKE